MKVNWVRICVTSFTTDHLNVWKSRTKVLLSTLGKDVGSDVDLLSSERDCASVIWFQQDTDGVQRKFQLGTQSYEDTAHLKCQQKLSSLEQMVI